MKKLLLFTVLLLSGLIGFSQGITTSSMIGIVTDQDGETLVGVNVAAIHTPTGSFYGTATDNNGNYRIDNMRVGGPYKVTVTYVGQEDIVLDDIYLSLGEPHKHSYIMGENTVMLGEVIVSARAGSIGTSTGTSTNISEEQISLMPTLGRNLNDYTRLTPQSGATFNGGTSLAGQNNRFNAIYVDGAVNNDVFGLAANGQNGGQTGIAPFSIDAIDQIQVVLSPYDVSYGGFAGGGINAVTKSGTNEFKGSAYYFLQNESLAGKTNKTLSDRALLQSYEREKLPEFSSKLYGLSLGGPIMKDKLFFFTNVEIQKDETPNPFAGEYDGDSSLDDIQALSNFLNSEYGYDAGSFGNKVAKLDGTRIFAKLDYNLSEQHTLTLRHNFTKGERTGANSSTFSNINFANNAVFFPTTTNSSALEINSRFGTSKSNSLIVGYTTVKDDRDPIGADFPNVRIRDGSNRNIFFGSEAFSTANALDQNVLTITDNFKLYKGNHTLTLGTHNEFISFYNLFIRQNYGAYVFNSLDDFYAGNVANYDRSYSLVDNLTGDGSAAAAEFSAAQFGVYAQDEWTANEKITITAGLRLDIPMLTKDPEIHESFGETIDSLSNHYDLEGAVGGQAPSGQLMWSPRIGVNYDMDNRTTVRGGIGVFTSRVPFVWPGGMYTNNGITIGGVDENDITDVEFNPDPLNQPTNPEFTVPSGQVDLFTKNFKYPQVFRTSLGLDREIGNGWNTSFEVMFTKTLNNVVYKNVNTDPTVDFNWTNGGDDRPVFTGDNIDPQYSAIYLASNTSEGSAYNLTASVNKLFASGFSLYAAYSFGEASAIFDGTSSQNSSQWRGTFQVDGRNNASIGRSDFALGNRFIASMGYALDWTGNNNYNTTFSLFYNGQSGNLYSYVYDSRNLNNERGSTSRERSLIYVPANRDDISLIDDGGVTADEQWDMLNHYIEEDDYLSGKRGQYAERNGSRTPFAHQIDFRIAQDIGRDFGGKGHKLQLSLDVFNIGNMINNNWGVVFNNPFNYEILNFEGYAADGTTPTFTFSEDNLGNNRFGIQDRVSRWRARVGVRYTFD